MDGLYQKSMIMVGSLYFAAPSTFEYSSCVNFLQRNRAIALFWLLILAASIGRVWISVSSKSSSGEKDIHKQLSFDKFEVNFDRNSEN